MDRVVFSVSVEIGMAWEYTHRVGADKTRSTRVVVTCPIVIKTITFVFSPCVTVRTQVAVIVTAEQRPERCIAVGIWGQYT